MPASKLGGLTADVAHVNNYAIPPMTKKANRRRVARAKPIPAGRRTDVTRAEFNRAIALLNERAESFNDLRHNQEMQFQRLAQLQAELDLLRRAFEKSRAS